jgi:hypothetical protein
MATIRFTAAERPGLLAEAVLEFAGQVPVRQARLEGLAELARTLNNGKAFDEALMEHYPTVALARIGVDRKPAVGVDPETGGEAEVEA